MSDRAIPPPDISPDAFFSEWIPARVAADEVRQQKLGETDTVIVFHLKAADGRVSAYTIHIEEGHVHAWPGVADDAELHVRLAEATWRKLNAGELSAPEAFVRRKVKLEGNLRLAIKLHLILG